MIRLLVTACACVVLVSGGAATASPSDTSQAVRESDVEAVAAILQQAAAKADAHDPKGAISQINAAIASPAFADAPDDLRRAAYLLLAACRYDDGDHKAAHEAAVEATGFTSAGGDDWRLRLFSADDADKHEVLTSLAKLAGNWPDQLENINSDYIHQLLSETRTEAALHDLRIQVLEGLSAAGWPKEGAPGEFDFMRVDLIGAYIDRGDKAKAVTEVKLIHSPYALARLRISKRYDLVRPDADDHLQIAPAEAAYLADLRTYAGTHPTKLEAIALLTRALIHEGKPAEALTLIDQALAKAAAAAKPGEAFSDYADQINWIFDNRSDALLLLDRTDEGLSAMAKGAGLKERGALNVSQTINLAGNYNAFGRPDQALAAVADVSSRNVSPFGRMQAEKERACAYAQLGDMANYQTKLKFVRDHVKDAPTTLADVLLCANDLDGAANAVVKLLGDPETRDRELEDLQDFARPSNDPPFQAEVRRRLVKVRERPEVRAAIDAVGRIESFPIYPEDY